MFVKPLGPPQFTVGQSVLCPPNLFEENTGVITEVDRLFKRVYDDDHGEFDPDGLSTQESQIEMLKYTVLKDDTLTTTFPVGLMHRDREVVSVSKPFGYAYTVRSPKGNLSIFSESSLHAS